MRSRTRASLRKVAAAEVRLESAKLADVIWNTQRTKRRLRTATQHACLRQARGQYSVMHNALMG